MDLSMIINTKDRPVPVRVADILAKDGTTKKLSFEIDTNGEAVLRVVDAAPFAYDPLTDTLKVTTVSGKPVETIYVFNNEEIRDTIAHTVSEFDLSKYKSILVYAYSSLTASDTPINTTIEIRFPSMGISTQTWNGSEWVKETGVTIAGDSFVYLLNTRFAWLDDRGFNSLGFRITASEVPDAGTISIVVVGVPN